MQQMLRDMHPDITVHGFRSTFKDWSSEMTRFPDHVSQAARAHVSAAARLATTCSRDGGMEGAVPNQIESGKRLFA